MPYPRNNDNVLVIDLTGGDYIPSNNISTRSRGKRARTQPVMDDASNGHKPSSTTDNEVIFVRSRTKHTMTLIDLTKDGCTKCEDCLQNDTGMFRFAGCGCVCKRTLGETMSHRRPSGALAANPTTETHLWPRE
ncbi:Uu.00g136970.m01.CDS01 [Anthostomella pinea]|uniref:Uu.00g136970.m01.CDS01 n=1 Tax=Anthostomella pinea TaxID=933095 RepID=A0AAI8YL14_9PEZI|nr:Uu.00g136970.m01.CDS01 [Anthostomella pinea]